MSKPMPQVNPPLPGPEAVDTLFARPPRRRYALAAATAVGVVGIAYLSWPSSDGETSEASTEVPRASLAAKSEPAPATPAPDESKGAASVEPPAAPPPEPPEEVAAPAAPPSKPRGLEGCRPISVARRLAGAAVPTVIPSVEAHADSKTFKVGFASAPLSAVGLEVDQESLDSEQVFDQTRAPYLTSVVPLSGPPGFAPARFGHPLLQSTVADGPSPFTIGLAKHGIGLAFLNGGGAFHWVTPRSITVPMVASSASFYGVVLRVIDRPSQIRYGRLTLDGKKETGLFTVSEGSVTDPAIALKDDVSVIAFANKREEGRWEIQLASAKGSEAPETPVPVEIPGLGAEDVQAPVLEPYSDSQLVLQWIEGPKRRLRALMLDWELHPVGKPLDVSKQGHVAQTSALAVREGRLFSVYTEGAGVERSLWASAFDCN